MHDPVARRLAQLIYDHTVPKALEASIRSMMTTEFGHDVDVRFVNFNEIAANAWSHVYAIMLGTGAFSPGGPFVVCASTEQDAFDELGDYLKREGLKGYYLTPAQWYSQHAEYAAEEPPHGISSTEHADRIMGELYLAAGDVYLYQEGTAITTLLRWNSAFDWELV